MTQRRSQLGQLREVEEVRQLQCLSAQISAMRDAQRADLHSRERQQCQHDVEGAEADWRRALSDGGPGDHSVHAWSTVVLQRIRQLNIADQRLSSSRFDCEEARRNWEHAMSRQEVASAFVRSSSRRVAAELEMRRDTELTEQYLARRTFP